MSQIKSLMTNGHKRSIKNDNPVVIVLRFPLRFSSICFEVQHISTRTKSYVKLQK